MDQDELVRVLSAYEATGLEYVLDRQDAAALRYRFNLTDED